MSVEIECRLSSPLLSLVERVDREKICSLLLCDYSTLNCFLSSEEVEKTIELYSLMFDVRCSSSSVLFSSLTSVLQVSDSSSSAMKDLIEIFRDESVRSLFNCYDAIVEGKNEDLYAKKLVEYNVDRLKLIHLEKREGERLGLTISRSTDDGERILVGRILYGSVAQGLFGLGEEILEINQIPLRCRNHFSTLDDLVHWIDSLHGHLSFLLRPVVSESETNPSFLPDAVDRCVVVRCLFDYNPSDDVYLPCRDLGGNLRRGDILQIVDCSDEYWWQAFLLQLDQQAPADDCSQPILIPSKQFQEKRFRIVKYFLDEQHQSNEKKKKKSISRQSILSTLNFVTYEPVQWLEVNPMRKRPIVFIGAPYLGRHEFRERLMSCDELATLIDVSIPHTTREQKSDEIDGRDYHFISRKQFEEDISNQLFVEYGEYEENLYGTSKSSIERCCHQRNRLTILNLLPEGLDALKYSNLYPYVIYFQVPDKIEQLAKEFHFNTQQWKEIQQKSATIEKNYAQFFDRTFCLTDSFQSIFSQLKLLIVQIQHQSMWINQSWFSSQERF